MDSINQALGLRGACMVKGLYTAYTGMVNEQKRLEVLTNNLANSATTGYKKEAMVAQAFDERLAIKIKDTSTFLNKPEGIGYISLGAKIGETYTNWDQGAFQITDKNSDVFFSFGMGINMSGQNDISILLIATFMFLPLPLRIIFNIS